MAQPSGSSGAGEPGENWLLSSVITHTPVVFRPCVPREDELTDDELSVSDEDESLEELLSELDESVPDDDEPELDDFDELDEEKVDDELAPLELELDAVAAATVWVGLSLCVAR